jgi:glutamate 5-kinase
MCPSLDALRRSPSLLVQEIKFGDNDTLSAITSAMIQANYLFLLTDVDGLYTSNPRRDPSAKLIEVVSSISSVRGQGMIGLICFLNRIYLLWQSARRP